MASRTATRAKPITRLPPEDRRAEILDAAIAQAQTKTGYRGLTRENVATRAGVSTGLVSHYFETMNALRRMVIKTAIEREILPIIAQALADGNLQARNAPDKLKTQALATLNR